ncbi:MAG: elongation factor P [Thermodesulfovibrionales bacterium]|nr:elongation factor P [Thermodesulfovibrionales bacterium]
MLKYLHFLNPEGLELISTADFRKGLKVEFKGEPCEIVDFQHVKMGRGGAIVRTKLKSLKTGSILEQTFRSGEKLDTPHLEEKKMQYLYAQDELFYFMDEETYEQIPLTDEQLGEARKFIKENMSVIILNYKDNPLSLELPTFVELAVSKTDPAGFRGDTASGSGKPATLETGAIVKVPFHINEGDTIKIDTRTSEYIERVK